MRRGFTLLELLVAITILGVVTIYLMETFTSNSRTYAVVDGVTESQQSLRALADLVESDVRHAGFMVPTAGAVCAVDNINAPDILYVSDAAAIEPAGQLDANLGSSFAGTNVAPGTNTLFLDLVLETPADPAYDTTGDGVNDSDFREDAGVIVIDRANPGRGSACGSIATVDVGAGRLVFDLESGPLAPGGAGASLVAIPAHEYRVNGFMQFMRDGMELARDTEDLQVAFFVDTNQNNLVDPGEYRGDRVGADYVSSAVDGSLLREMRVNVVVRTALQDPTFRDGQFQTTENRVAVAGNDGYRRRVHTSTALLRNVAARAGL